MGESSKKSVQQVTPRATAENAHFRQVRYDDGRRSDTPLKKHGDNIGGHEVPLPVGARYNILPIQGWLIMVLS
jgi:hypothetical protein